MPNTRGVVNYLNDLDNRIVGRFHHPESVGLAVKMKAPGCLDAEMLTNSSFNDDRFEHLTWRHTCLRSNGNFLLTTFTNFQKYT